MIVTFQAQVAGNASGSLINIATVSVPAGMTDTVPGNNAGSVTVTIGQAADLSLVKLAGNSTPSAGGTLTYSLVISNAGPSTAVGASFADSLPAGLGSITNVVSQGAGGNTVTAINNGGTSVSGSATIVAGGSVIVTFQAQVAGNASGSLINIATVSVPAGMTDTVPGNNTGSASITVTVVVDINVALSVPATAAPDTTVTATITVNNTGPSTAQNVTITLTLTLPNGSTTIVTTVGALPSGSTTIASLIYKVPPAQSTTMSFTATVATTTPETTTANNVAKADTTVLRVANASLSGRVWLDSNGDRQYTSGVDLDLVGWRAELLQNSVVIGSATTGLDGRYQITGQVPGSDYTVRFKNPAGLVVVSTPFNQTAKTSAGHESTGVTTSIRTGTSYIVGGSIDKVTLYAGDNTIEQNLPIDPSGIVYDAVTRKPVAGAVVTLLGPDGQRVPDANLLQNTSQITTAADGVYQFDLLPVAPSGRYRLEIVAPAGYANSAAVLGGVAPPQLQGTGYTPPTDIAFIYVQPNTQPPAANVVGIRAPGAASVGTLGTQYFFEFNLTTTGATSAGVLHNHIPLDPLTSGAILVTKVGDKTVAEVGDSVRYTITMRNTTNKPIASVSLEDLLPAGFRYIPGTARLNKVALADPAGGIGRALDFVGIGIIPANTTYELSYFVRLGVGSQQGDGINRATAVFPGANNAPVRSNTALFKVNVQGGVFSNEGCITGKVYIDCDGNAIQNNNGGTREVGIPGVRLVMLDGSFIITDPEGKYSVCGVKPQTHVIKVDRTTLPKGARMVPSSNRNAGVGDSIFVDLKGGELARADFIEGSCSPEVLEQVNARRAQGAVLAPELANVLPLRLDSRPGEVQQQILPGTRQLSAPANSRVVP